MENIELLLSLECDDNIWLQQEGDGFNSKLAHKFLRSLSVFDRKMVEVVEDSEALRGMPAAALKQCNLWLDLIPDYDTDLQSTSS